MTQTMYAAKVIEFLELLQERPGICLGVSDDVDKLNLFLKGFNACHVLIGHIYSSEINCQVLSENGWECLATGVWLQMRKRGMKEEAIVQELIWLEVEKWKKFAIINPSA